MLARLLDAPAVPGSIDVVPFRPQSAQVWHKDKLGSHNRATVPGAMQSAYSAVRRLLGD